MCIFGDTVGYLIFISEIQTERKNGGTVTYQETYIRQKLVFYRGAFFIEVMYMDYIHST